MTADDLAAELLDASLDADPLSASLYGFLGYDDRLPDMSAQAERDMEARLSSIAERAATMPGEGLDETARQTLDFVRHMASNMAGAAGIPMSEFTISDTFVAPVGAILNALPKVPLDTRERRDGYVARLNQLTALLATVSERHAAGIRNGRTPVARLVEGAAAQLDLVVSDTTAGGLTRPDQAEHEEFSRQVTAAVDEKVRPGLAAYRDRLRADVLPAARDDEHPGLCHLPGGEDMYEVLVRLHTSMAYTPDALHAMGLQIVEAVHDEFREVGSRLWGLTDVASIFERMVGDPALRYETREEMLEHARRVVAARRGRGAEVVRRRPRRALCGRTGAGGRGRGYGAGLLHGRRHGRLKTGDVLPEHLEARGALAPRLRGHRVPRSRAGAPLPVDDRPGVRGARPGATGARRHRVR